MTDKLRLLTLNQVTMAEVSDFVRMSGFTVAEVAEHVSNQGGVPESVLMALAYITEKRDRDVTRDKFTSMTFTEFASYLDEHFDYEEDDEDPTEAA